MEIHNCNIQRKLDIHIHFCNTLLVRKSMVITGIRLYSKMPDLIKKIGQDQIIYRRAEILSVINMCFIQWMHFHHNDCIWIL
jgi:hypothetical protein